MEIGTHGHPSEVGVENARVGLAPPGEVAVRNAYYVAG